MCAVCGDSRDGNLLLGQLVLTKVCNTSTIFQHIHASAAERIFI